MKSTEKANFNVRKAERNGIFAMFRTSALGLVALFCLITIGCSKDAEINSFLTEWDAVTNEIVEKIDANPSAAGVDDAQKTWDERKAALKAKWDDFKDARGFQVSQDTQKKMEESARKNVKALTGVMSKNVIKLATDKIAAEKFKKLMEDYGNTFKL